MAEEILDEPMINAVLVLVVVTSILGPVLTEYFGRQRIAELDAAATCTASPAEVANPATSP